MDSKILGVDDSLQQYRVGLSDLLAPIAQLLTKTRNATTIKTVQGLQATIDNPFMFVVIGEVKAGKSSFVNALLESEVCATDVAPCTDTVQVISYAPEPYRKQINSSLVELGKPIEILREIAIVDTPGTNSIIENHQLITEEFIPNSDLAFFVLFAKNPYFATTWDFLDFVSAQWLRKVVFVLQQSDLMDAESLAKNVAEVKKIAEKKGVSDPVVFTTSAQLEIQSNGQADSGFAEIRDYIKDLVTTKDIYKLKLTNVTNTIRRILEELDSDVANLKAQLDADLRAVELVKGRFERGRRRSQQEVDITATSVTERYSTISSAIKEEFRQEISFLSVIKRSFTFSLKKRLEYFSDRCKTKLESEIDAIAQERASFILDGIRQFGDDLKLDLDKISARQIDEGGRFQIKVLERRQDLLDNIKNQVGDFVDGDGLVQSLNTGLEGAALGMGGALAAVSVVVAQVIEVVVASFALAAFEVALIGIGMVFFAVGFAWRRRSIITKFEQTLDNGKQQLERDFTQKLNERLGIIYDDLERVCAPLYDDIEQEEREIRPLLESYESISADAEQLFAQSHDLLR
ncbi:MAG: dynamin family protein [Cyanobacteria bacterium J06597_1]